MFSKPVSCLFKPVLIATNDCSPLICMTPSSISLIPAKISDRVDFPEPLVPKIPTTSPCGISKLIFFKA